MIDPVRDTRTALADLAKAMRSWLEADEIPRAQVEEALFEVIMLLDDLS